MKNIHPSYAVGSHLLLATLQQEGFKVFERVFTRLFGTLNIFLKISFWLKENRRIMEAMLQCWTLVPKSFSFGDYIIGKLCEADVKFM